MSGRDQKSSSGRKVIEDLPCIRLNTRVAPTLEAKSGSVGGMMTKRLFLVALLVVGFGMSMPATFAASELDFTVANKTGYGIAELYVAPSASTTWEENLLEEVLENGEEIEISFDPKSHTAKKWDIMITFVDDDSKVYWKAVKLEEITKLTLKYDRKSGQTSATSE
jgi:hypothetical protein